MQKSRKRKQPPSRLQLSPSIKSPTKSAKIRGADETTNEPYPYHPRPTPEECQAVRDDLLALHGFPKEFAKYRKQTPNHPPINGLDENNVKSEPLDEKDHAVGSSGPKHSVLDGLVSIILSQNTTDANSQRAFASLKSAFPGWEDVIAAESKCVENAIRCGGLAPTKASCIKNMLSCLLEKKGKICLEYLRDLSVDEVKAELSHFKGIGPKTVACVLMFHLQQDDFPVDTHVFQIAKSLSWVPAEADRKKTYLHLNQRIPNELKFDLNCLLFTHDHIQDPSLGHMLASLSTSEV
ncbi:hypothetical protein F0562_023875 [Nyssa sinensis]|uniref:HhH-GPD domain-containing protein n=1 Tax=Nyssa sinensis TaxID=561372 RepID=A0A5J5BIZ7_9ASTE|nr:hypothetical protein F0562_023875 [Nyssa sinensis]